MSSSEEGAVPVSRHIPVADASGRLPPMRQRRLIEKIQPRPQSVENSSGQESNQSLGSLRPQTQSHVGVRRRAFEQHEGREVSAYTYYEDSENDAEDEDEVDLEDEEEDNVEDLKTAEAKRLVNKKKGKSIKFGSGANRNTIIRAILGCAVVLILTGCGLLIFYSTTEEKFKHTPLPEVVVGPNPDLLALQQSLKQTGMIFYLSNGTQIRVQTAAPLSVQTQIDLPQVFYSNVFFGIFVGDFQSPLRDEKRTVSRQDFTNALENLQKRLSPAEIIRCLFQLGNVHDPDGDHEYDGYCLRFNGKAPPPNAELYLKETARKLGQRVIFKWWPHVWGSHRTLHAAVIQSTIPTAPNLQTLRTSSPLYRIDEDANQD